MITLEDLRKFFDVENSDADSANKEFDEKSLDEKIQEGKAIKGLILDKDFKQNEDGDEIRLLHTKENLSEFKIGDNVTLYTEQGNSFICDCSISDFRENGDIEISINPYNFSSSIDEATNCNLILIKQSVSMRNFYSNFCNLNSEFYKDGYFEQHLINQIPHPTIEGDFDVTAEQNYSAFKNALGITLNPAQLSAVTNSELVKDYYLIQGPPGTGKSFLLAAHILDCILSKQKIVIVAPTHMAINNLLLKIAELCAMYFNDAPNTVKMLIKNALYKCGQSYNAKGLSTMIGEETIAIQNIQYINTSVFNDWKWKDQEDNDIEAPLGYAIGMTPYSLQSRRAKGIEIDELIIDEAGQMTIPIAMMALVKYKKVILAGDHKQLPPIISVNHDAEELKHSIFEHLVRDYNSTMLNVSFRMNDVICDFVSTLFYDGKLKSFDGKKRLSTSLFEPIYSSNNPIVFIDCKENGKQYSKAEASKAIELLSTYIKSGISPNDIAILAPFRAQCALIRKMLMGTFTKEIRDLIVIDTVDRMQGQERQIIIYTFTSGDIEYMRQMEEFLYNPHKMNVAFSRAKNKLILLGNFSAMQKIGSTLLNNILGYNNIFFSK